MAANPQTKRGAVRTRSGRGAKARAPRVLRHSTVSCWGHSLGVRIPREAVEQLALKAGEQVSIEVRSDSITITPARRRRKWSEAELLKGVTPAMVGGEVDWGGPVGKEVW